MKPLEISSPVSYYSILQKQAKSSQDSRIVVMKDRLC